MVIADGEAIDECDEGFVPMSSLYCQNYSHGTPPPSLNNAATAADELPWLFIVTYSQPIQGFFFLFQFCGFKSLANLSKKIATFLLNFL